MKSYENIQYFIDKTKGIELVSCSHSTLSYPVHNHISVYTVGFITDGSLTVSTCHGSQLYNKGDIFIIPPYIPHSIQTAMQYSLLSLCISRQTLEDQEYNAVIESFRKMLRFITDLDNLHLYINSVYPVLYKLFHCETHSCSQLTNSVNIIRKRLELFPEETYSIDEMAKAAFLSKYHFIRNFKHEVGLTPHQFQLQNRVRKAQRLLHQTNKITEVALEAGFCDQSHFIKQFEKIVRLTPSKYITSCNILETHTG